MIKLGKKTISSSSVFSFWLKKCQNGAFPRIFIGARSNPSYKTCIPFWHIQSAWTPPPIHKNYQSLILTLEWPGTWHNEPKKSSYLVKRARNLTPGGAKRLLQSLLLVARNQAKTFQNYMKWKLVFLNMMYNPN